MAMVLASGSNPELVVLIVSLALIFSIFGNTYYSMLMTPSYKWQYGLFRLIAFFGMAVLTYSTAGFGAVLPTLTTFLGMELQRLMTKLDIAWSNGNGFKISKK